MMAYHKITDRTLGKSVSATLEDIANGNVIVEYDDRKPVVDALMRDLKEGGVAKNWNERERVLALQALKTLGRATEGCDSIYTDEGLLTLIYHSGLTKATEVNVDTVASKEALKCLANSLLLKPHTKKTLERLGNYGNCSLLLKKPTLSNESQFLYCRILFLMTMSYPPTVKSLMNDYGAVDNLGHVLKAQLKRSPDNTMFNQTMVLSEALKFLYNLVTVDLTVERSEEALFTQNEKVAASGRRFQSLVPLIVSILTTIPLKSPNPLEAPHSHAIHVLLNVPVSTSSAVIDRTQQGNLLNVLIHILDETLKNSLNTDEEALTARLSNDTELDEIIPPLVLVLTNIAASGKEAKAYVKSKLLPHDIDRSKPLEKGDTFTSRLVRRMTSIRFLHTRESVCQLLFVLCNKDASTLTNYVGYGNAAGFLLNNKLGVPSSVTGAKVEEIEEEEEVEEIKTKSTKKESSGSKSSSSNKPPINPITGAYFPDPSAYRSAIADMTEEEKEEEAGRLLDMFDKMRRTGVMEVRNPALEAGLRQREKDRYYDEQEKREQEEEEELERIYGKV